MKTIGQEPRVRVAGIVIEDNKLLLIAHKKNNSVYWLLPGGGVNYGESLEEACAVHGIDCDVLIDELNNYFEVKDLPQANV